jgi:ADP-ribosylglycohydrolase
MPIPDDYEERVYAGVLGKIIGVYLGRPFEGWPHRRIMDELGEVNYYVHGRLGQPLIQSDDDISGTFTFVRALEDHGISRDITAEQIGKAWLNYLIEERTILWWGGLGTSTEHTAFLRLKHGTPAPKSGSIAVNGQVVAEQIGAQIFIDSWAMVAPGEPELAADLARKAGSVSHDGEAVYGAQVLAAMEAAAFVEPDIQKLLDIGLSYIPADSIIARLIGDVRAWHAADGDWLKTFGRIEEKYGYDKYGGGCHMVPNHAVIILGLLYGDDDFQKSQMITNTAGWDTDCNAGNVGCLMGIKNGLAGLETGPDWRGPVADRLFKISADGGDALTDAAREACRIASIGRSLLGAPKRRPHKDGARYHFELPGSVHGFMPDDAPECEGAASVANLEGHSRHGHRCLAIALKRIGPGRPARVGVETFGSPDMLGRSGYRMIMSPSVASGQTVQAHVNLSEQTSAPISVQLYAKVFPLPGQKTPPVHYGPPRTLSSGDHKLITWKLPDTGGAPILAIGVSCSAEQTVAGILHLDSLTWSGAPDSVLTGPGLAELKSAVGWTDGADIVGVSSRGVGSQITLIQNEGRGLLINGTQEWADYRLSARVSVHMASEAGIAVRVGGMRRFYALLLTAGGTVRLVGCQDEDKVLSEAAFDWEPDRAYQLSIEAQGDRLIARVEGGPTLLAQDTGLARGGIALINTEGRSFFSEVCVTPLGG